VDDGRILAALALLGLTGAAVARGSRAEVRKGRGERRETVNPTHAYAYRVAFERLRGLSHGPMADELLNLDKGDLRRAGLPERIIGMRNALFLNANGGFDDDGPSLPQQLEELISALRELEVPSNQGSRGIVRSGRGMSRPSLPKGVSAETVLEEARLARVVVEKGITPKLETKYLIQIVIGSGRGSTVVAVGGAKTLKTAQSYQERVLADKLGYTVPIALYHLVDQKTPWDAWRRTELTWLGDPQPLPVEIEELLQREGSRSVVRAGRRSAIRFTDEDRDLIDRARREVPSGSNLRDALQPIYHRLHNNRPIRREELDSLDAAVHAFWEEHREHGWQDIAEKRFAPIAGELRALLERFPEDGSRSVVRTGRTSCKDFEARKVFTVSTRHIRESDADWLMKHVKGTQDDAIFGGPNGYGWMIWASSDLDTVELLHKGLSDEFVNLFHYAVRCEADWVQIDQDGPEVKGLPRFEW
jgi:hypothetical protein